MSVKGLPNIDRTAPLSTRDTDSLSRRNRVAAMTRLMSSLSILAFLISVAAFARAETYDLLIRGGRVVDGTGSPAAFADVAVKDGRIAAIGKHAGGATTTLDVQGLVVAPGFIDVHTHAEDIEDLPLAENFLRMGVTTLVLGNCGGSKLNVGEFFRKLEAMRISPNVATLIGHNTVRAHVMGGAVSRQPTGAELTRRKVVSE